MHPATRSLLSAAVLALGLVPLGAPRATAQQVSCGLLYPLQVTADPVSFGNYLTTSSSPTTSNGRVTITCGSQIMGVFLPSFTIALSQGQAGAFAPRKMANGTARLNYNLYTNASCTTVWGDGTGGTITMSYPGTGSSTTTSMTVYGCVPASQPVAAGSYTDTITVTISY